MLSTKSKLECSSMKTVTATREIPTRSHTGFFAEEGGGKGSKRICWVCHLVSLKT